MAILDFAADKGGRYAAADGVGVIPRAWHQITRERAGANYHVRFRLFGNAKHGGNIQRKMLTIAVESDDMSEAVGLGVVDTHTQSRGLAAIHL